MIKEFQPGIFKMEIKLYWRIVDVSISGDRLGTLTQGPPSEVQAEFTWQPDMLYLAGIPYPMLR